MRQAAVAITNLLQCLSAALMSHIAQTPSINVAALICSVKQITPSIGMPESGALKWLRELILTG